MQRGISLSFCLILCHILFLILIVKEGSRVLILYDRNNKPFRCLVPNLCQKLPVIVIPAVRVNILCQSSHTYSLYLPWKH